MKRIIGIFVLLPISFLSTKAETKASPCSSRMWTIGLNKYQNPSVAELSRPDFYLDQKSCGEKISSTKKKKKTRAIETVRYILSGDRHILPDCTGKELIFPLHASYFFHFLFCIGERGPPAISAL